MPPVAPDNVEATEAWSGVLFDRFVEYRDLIQQKTKETSAHEPD